MKIEFNHLKKYLKVFLVLFTINQSYGQNLYMSLFWISFIGIVLQMNHNLGLADGGEMQSTVLGMSSLLIVLTLLSIYLTKKAVSNNWIE